MTFRYVDTGFLKLASLDQRRWLIIASVFIAVIFLDGVISSGVFENPTQDKFGLGIAEH